MRKEDGSREGVTPFVFTSSPVVLSRGVPLPPDLRPEVSVGTGSIRRSETRSVTGKTRGYGRRHSPLIVQEFGVRRKDVYEG